MVLEEYFLDLFPKPREKKACAHNATLHPKVAPVVFLANVTILGRNFLLIGRLKINSSAFNSFRT